MAALGFKQQFVAPIKRKKDPKDQTIRAFRKFPIKPGERLYLFTGMRTRNCKKIGEAICLGVHRIILDTNGYRLGLCEPSDNEGYEVWFHMYKGRDNYNQERLDEFARRDGFRNWDKLIAFWKLERGEDCFPFEGELIRFRLLPKKHWKKQVPESKLA